MVKCSKAESLYELYKLLPYCCISQLLHAYYKPIINQFGI